MPLTDAVVEDVQAVTHPGQRRKWNASFSPVQVGKEHLYRLLRELGLTVHVREGWQTKELREQYRLKKTKSKSKQSFESHAVDAWVLAASVGGVDRAKGRISLHEYRTNERLTQGAKVEACRVLAWVAWRSWFVVEKQRASKGKGSYPTPAPNKERLFPSTS